MNYFCGECKQRKPLIDDFDAWVALWVLHDVRVEDVHKFKFLPSEEQHDSEESDGTIANDTEYILRTTVGLDGEEDADDGVIPTSSVGRDSKGTVVNNTEDDLKTSIGSESEGTIANDTDNNSEASVILNGEGSIAKEAGNNLEPSISLDDEGTTANDVENNSKGSVILGSEGSTANYSGGELEANVSLDSDGTLADDTARIGFGSEEITANEVGDNIEASVGSNGEEVTANDGGDNLEENADLNIKKKQTTAPIWRKRLLTTRRIILRKLPA